MRSLPVNMFHQTHAGIFTAWLGTLPSSPVLVVFDSLSRSMIGGDESSNQDMSSIVANMDRIRHLYGRARGAAHRPRRPDPRARRQRAHERRRQPHQRHPPRHGCAPRPTQGRQDQGRRAPSADRPTGRDRPEPRDREREQRGAGQARRHARQIIRHLDANRASSKNAVEDAVKANRDAIRGALETLVADGSVVTAKRARVQFFIPSPSRASLTLRPGAGRAEQAQFDATSEPGAA
jgi:hypothetical protein